MVLNLTIGFKTIKKWLPNFQNVYPANKFSKKLKNAHHSEFNFPEGAAIFINESLCSYCKMLWKNVRSSGKTNYFTRNLPQFRIFDTGLAEAATGDIP